MRTAKSLLFTILALVAAASAQTNHATAAPARKPKTSAASEVRYYGAVDLGSKGTKAALYSFVTEEDGRTPLVVFSKTVNTKLVSSMKDGAFTKEGIADAADAVKQDVDAMKAEAAKEKIHVDTYYVVGSSGVAKSKNKDDLIAAVKAATGIDMDFVDAGQEGYYGLLSAVPLSRRPTSMYIDIGSGNAKLGCLVGSADIKSFKSAEIPYGSVSGRNEALKRNPKDLDAGLDSVITDVNSSYEDQSRDIPCLRNRQRIYWTGGAAWATATFMHPEGEMNGWVTITKHDLDTFLARLKDGTWNQKQPVFTFPKDMPLDKQQTIRAKATKEREDVQNVFVREDLLSGVSIMRAVLNSSNPSASIRFVRSGNYIYGYALEKFTENASREARENSNTPDSQTSSNPQPPGGRSAPDTPKDTTTSTKANMPPPHFKDTPFTVKLTAPLSSKTSEKGQEVTAQVVTPAAYKGWFMIGQVDNSKSSGSMKKTSELRFSFHKLSSADGSQQYPVNATVTSFTNSKGEQNTDEEGQIVEQKNPAVKAGVIGGLAGAGVGAIFGGAKGAAIGAGAGAGAGVLFATFGVKGPSISFDSGSQFGLSVNSSPDSANSKQDSQ